MRRFLASRLDRHFTSAAALAVAAAAVAGGARSAHAAIVYSGVVNINIPSTTAGVYLNVVTGVNATAPAGSPGWDLNLYSLAPDLRGWQSTPTTPANVWISSGGNLSNLPAGFMIDGSAGYLSASPLASTTAPAGYQSVLNGTNTYGFKFINEANGNQIHYGWVKVAVSGTFGEQPRTVVEYAYEDTAGVGIGAGVTSSNPNFGSCCLPNGVCTLNLAADCTTQGGTAGAVGSNCAAANCAARCCMADGTCQMLGAAACASAGGVSTANADCTAACPQPGACCRNDGTCSVVPQTSCVTSGNVTASFAGAGVTCAAAECGKYTVVSNVAGTFTDISATGTAFSGLAAGSLDDGTYTFTSSVTNSLVNTASLIVSTNGDISTVQAFTNFTNTVIPATAAGPLALYAMWDDLDNNSPSQIYHQATTENGVAVEIVQWNTFHHGTTNGNGVVQLKIFAPGGPALVQYLFQDLAWNWNGNSATIGVQWDTNRAFQYSFGTNNAAGGPIPNNAVLSVVAAGTTGPACYANCDSSTAVPFLNVQDFSCFLQKYSSGAAYANCDGSTQPPALNVQDFSCFLQKFSAGCSAP